jgi:hypothetical protein
MWPSRLSVSRVCSETATVSRALHLSPQLSLACRVFQAPLTKPTSATSSLQISAHPIKYRHRPITIYLSISTTTTTSNSVAARSSILSTHPASPLSQSAHVVTQRAAGVGDHDGRAPRQGTAGSEPSERALRPTESVVQDLACGAAIAAVRHWCS